MASSKGSQPKNSRPTALGADFPVAGSGVPLEACAAKKSLARIRHDINNTMQALVGTAELLVMDVSLAPGTRQSVERLWAVVQVLRENVRELARHEPSAELMSATNQSVSLDTARHPGA